MSWARCGRSCRNSRSELSYRSRIDQTLSGTENFTYDTAGIAATINALTGAFANSRGSTDLPTPAVVTGGARWAIDDRWTALGGIEYTNWSSLKQLLIVPDNPLNPSALTVLNWKNTWFGSLGGEYRYDNRLTLRLGGAYDEAAAPSETVEPRIPDANRYWLSGGVGYRWFPGTDLNFAVSHLFTPHSTVNQTVFEPGNAARGSLAGVSNSDATLISLQIVMREPFTLFRASLWRLYFRPKRPLSILYGRPPNLTPCNTWANKRMHIPGPYSDDTWQWLPDARKAARRPILPAGTCPMGIGLSCLPARSAAIVGLSLKSAGIT